MEVKQLDKFLYGCVILGDLVSVSSVWGKVQPLYIPESLVFCSSVTVILVHGFTIGFVWHFLLISFTTLMVKEESGQWNSADFWYFRKLLSSSLFILGRRLKPRCERIFWDLIPVHSFKSWTSNTWTDLARKMICPKLCTKSPRGLVIQQICWSSVQVCCHKTTWIKSVTAFPS